MIFYVSNNGDDSNDGLSLGNAFLTLEKAVSSVTEESTIYVDSGTYELSCIQALSSCDGKCIIRSLSTYVSDIPTIIVTSSALNSYNNNLDVYDMIFIPSDNFSGDTRVISYNSDDYAVNFYNCVFGKSRNGSYPTKTFFYCHPSSNAFISNKSFYNCTFDGGSKLYDNAIAKANFYNCALSTLRTDSNVYTDCIFDANLNDSYKLTSEDNSLYGVYSGKNAWISFSCLLFSDGNYYSIKEKYYDVESKAYLPLTEDQYNDGMFLLSKLLIDVTIGSETFKPIEKFSHFKICSASNVLYTLNGIKSSKEMIIGKSSFSTKFAENIDYFSLANESGDLGRIKMAFSIDDGTTWKTYNSETNEFTDLDVIIPSSDYNTFSSDELNNWNNALNEIYNNGIDATSLSGINFNSLSVDKIKFAYVLSASSAASMDSMKNLTWQFDAKGTMQLCDSSEVGIGIVTSGVKVTSKIDTDILRTNILYDAE